MDNTDTANEKQLIERVIKGSTIAFEQLMHPYAKALVNYIMYRIKNEANAKDIIQDTMLSIWQNIASFSHRSSFKTWTYTIARRRLADFYRTGAKHETSPLNDYANNLPAKDSLTESEERMDIRQAMQSLDHKDNELVHLIFQAQLSYQEISEVLGIPVGTIKSRMSAIKGKLRPLLETGVKDKKDVEHGV